MTKPKFPAPEEIKVVIKKLESKKDINKLKSKSNTEEGIEYCIKLLNDRIENPENPYFIAESEEEWININKIFKSQIQGIEKLKELQSRSMAMLCVDWLNGNDKSINFLNKK